MNNLTVFEQMRGTRIPDYYDGMYKDGFQPWEIVEAAHNTILRQAQEREAARETGLPMNVNINSEVKVK